MNFLIKSTPLLLAVIFFLYACSEESITNPPGNENVPVYFPGSKGSFYKYEIIESDTNGILDRISSDAIKYWWHNKSKSFSNFEFFHYNKGDEEWKMEVLFNSNSKKPEVYMDQIEGVMLWI